MPFPFGFGRRDWDKYMNSPDCPNCQSDVFVEEISDADSVVTAGLYVCGKCGTSFIDKEEGEGAVIRNPRSPSTPDTSNRHVDSPQPPAPRFGTVTEET